MRISELTKGKLETAKSINSANLNDVKEFGLQKKQFITKSKSGRNRAYLLIAFLTVDEFQDNPSVSIIGYSYFPLFLNIDTDLECRKVGDMKYYLKNGHYQIPVYKDSYQDTNDPISMKYITENFEKIPACTLCVRIYPSGGTPKHTLVTNRGNEKSERWGF